MASQKAPEKWTSALTGLFIIILSAAGIYASLGLLNSEIQILRDPLASLGCDINPLIGCSESILTPQAHVLTIPNSALGLAAFSALAALGAVMAFGGGLPRFVWLGAAAGGAGGIAFVIYFLILSVTKFKALCPYCLVTWVAALGVAPLLFGGAAASGALTSRLQPLGKSVLRYSWAIALGLYLAVVLVIVFAMPDKVRILFG